MHGRIFEIREERLPREEWMNESSFYEEETGSWCDWMRDSEDRKDDLNWLKSALPSSIFKVRGGVIEVISDGKEYIEEWIEGLKKQIDELTTEKAKTSSAVHSIKRNLEDMIDVDFMFYTDYTPYPHLSTEFIRDCINNYQGKKLYVCGIIDYHY